MDQKSDSLLIKELEEALALLERRIDREKRARKEAEELLESKSLELFKANKELDTLNKYLEKNILRRNQTLVTLLNSLHAGVVLNDENGELIFVNNTFLKIFQVQDKPTSLHGMPRNQLANIVAQKCEDQDQFENALEKCSLSSEDVIGHELLLADHRILECDIITIKPEGDFVGRLWQFREVTEERVSQNKIRASEEKYRGIIENMQLGLMEVDLDHNITRAFDWFCGMTGYEEEELIGKNALEVFLPKEEAYYKLIHEEDMKRAEGKQGIYESKLIKKNGEEMWVLISGAPIYNEEGSIVGSIGIHYDITDRKNLEKELRLARNQAETARDAEKQFLANMSHEIRNPINAIIGMTNLLYDTRPTRAQLEYLDKIKYSSDILLGLISGILDISKIESGNFEFVERKLDIRATLEALINIEQFRTSHRNVSVNLQLDSATDFNVMADPTIINQVFLNLISNALKFTDEGAVNISGTLLDESDDELEYVFAVQDTGIGIASDKLEGIFESFNQGDSETKLKYGGTGLGLSIVKMLVERYNGEIGVESPPGSGSTFQFTMRFKRPDVADEIKTEYIVRSRACHVLIVEDNLINQQYLSGLLDNWHVTYDIANHGMEAMELIEDNRYDMVLMDIRMPIMDGYETTIRIRSRKSNPNAELPIVALTASALVDEKEKALAAGMNFHLTKPFTPDQLAKVFEQFGLVEMVKAEAPSGFEFSDELDVDYLLEMYADDYDRAKMIFEIFLDTINDEFAELAELINIQDWDKFSSLAHRIKPNFAMVGLSELSEMMKFYESARDHPDNRPKIISEWKSVTEKFASGREIVENELVKMKDTGVI